MTAEPRDTMPRYWDDGPRPLLCRENHTRPNSPLALVLPVIRPCQTTVDHPHGRKEDTGVSDGDKSICPVARSCARGGSACRLRPTYGHRAICLAWRQRADVCRASG